MKAAAIEYELERATGWRGGEEIDNFETTSSGRLGSRLLDSDFRDIDAQHGSGVPVSHGNDSPEA